MPKHCHSNSFLNTRVVMIVMFHEPYCLIWSQE
jgi:hypothetical protein